MNGLWICVDERLVNTKLYYFRKKFTAGTGATLNIMSSGDSRYQLFVNGNMVVEGPCQGSSYQTYYETADCTKYLVEGENEIKVKLVHVGEGSWISVYRQARPALYVTATLIDNGEDKSFRTDESWECLRDDGTEFMQGVGCHSSIPQFEIVSAEEKLTPVPVTVMYEADLEHKCYNPWGLNEKYVLEERPIPQMEIQLAKALSIVRSGDGFIELDAGEYTTAKLKFRFRGEKGKKVKIIYSECYVIPDGKGDFYKNKRDDVENGVLQGVWDTVNTNSDVQEFVPFWYRAFRFIRIEYEGKLELLTAEYEKYFYPMDITGKFECSDKQLNDMWRVSINTVRCSMHEIYVDCPYYEQQQYDMDSALEAMFTYRFTDDTRMQKKCITDMAHSQMQNGLLQANYPSVVVQIIPDFSLFWILMLGDYLEYTGDRKFALSMTGTADRVLEGLRSYMDDRGLIGPTPFWPFVDWVPTWPIGTPVGGLTEPLTVTCLMYSAALRRAAWICRECGRDGLAEDYMKRSEEMNRNVRKYCYDGERKLFRNTPANNDFAEHTTLWAILADAVTGKEATELMERTLTEDVARCTFSMNHYMFRALEKSGCYKYADKVLDGWRRMLDMHCTTWCENPDSPRSECHGWSSAPAYELSAIYLGVKPEKPGYDGIVIAPYIDNVDSAKGCVPTPHGLVSVAWEKRDGRLIFTAEVPKGIKTTVLLPGAEKFIATESLIHKEIKL